MEFLQSLFLAIAASSISGYVGAESVLAQQTDISFEFVGDMNGWIPNWLMALIQKKWPFKFIEGLKEEGPKRALASQS